jgi:bacteriorhodopsin
MAAGGGSSYHIVHISHKYHKIVFRQIYWARYVDWAITTPLLLLDLTILAGLPGADILLAVFADVAMVLFVHPHKNTVDG